MSKPQDFSTGDELLNFLGQAPKETTETLNTILEEQPQKEVETVVEPVVQQEPPKVEDFKPLEDLIPKDVVTPSSEKNSIVKRYLEDGYWEDVIVKIQTEDGTEKEVPISELEDVDDDTFKQLKDAQENLKKTDFESKYISKEGLDEKTLKLIEIARNGRFDEIQDLLKVQTEIVHPLQGLDTSDEKVQEWIVAQTLKNQGLDDIVISNTIKQYKDNLILDQKADAVVQQIDKMYNEQVDLKLKEVEQQKIAEKENQKLFKKSVSEQYKSLQINDSLKKSLIDSATKYDEYGISQTDKLYYEAKKDPEFFAEINFILNNKEEYNKYKGIKVANETNKKNFITIMRTEKKSSSQKQMEEDNNRSENPLNRFLTPQG